MKPIGEKLRAAREAQGRSIEDIALAIRIDRKFLQTIELGTPPNLPTTYVRAFISDYAREVGLNPADLFAESESVGSEQVTVNNCGRLSTNHHGLSNLILPVPVKKFHRHQLRVLMLVIVLIVIGFVVTVFWMNSDSGEKSVEEISFSEVIREQEQKVNPLLSTQDTMMIESVYLMKDSLILEGISSDSVWIKIAADGNPPAEYSLPPFYKKSWKAKKTFMLSIGDAAAISFTINGQKMGSLSPTKRPMKNVTIDWEAFRKLRNRQM